MRIEAQQMSENGSDSDREMNNEKTEDTDQMNKTAEDTSPESFESKEEGGQKEDEDEDPATTTPTLSPQELELQQAREINTQRKFAIRLQAVVRKFKARLQLPDLLAERYEKIYDPVQKRCFYYNKETDTSTWKKPTILGQSDLRKVVSLYSQAEAVLMLQCWYRTYVSKKRVRRKFKHVVKVLKNAAATGKYHNPRTKQHMWELPYFMGGVIDHDYSSGSEEDEAKETRKEKRDRIKQEQKERKAKKRAAKKAKKAAKKAAKKKKKKVITKARALRMRITRVVSATVAVRAAVAVGPTVTVTATTRTPLRKTVTNTTATTAA